MGRAAALSILVMAATLVGACGTVSSSARGSASAATAASASSTPPASQRLALVALTSSSPVGIYDVHDPAAPRLIKSLGAAISRAPGPRFLSASTIAYISIPNFTPTTSFTDFDSRLTVADLQKGDAHTVVEATGDMWAFAWSGDQRSVAYELETAAGWQFWLKPQAGSLVALTGVLQNVKFEGGRGDGVWVAYSPSGTYLALANTFAAGAHLQVFRVSDGSKVWSTAKGGSLFWSRQTDRLYFEDSAGEHAWDPPASVATVFADGWVDPSPSPDGCCVAYSVEDSQPLPHVVIYRWTSSATSVLPASDGGYPNFVAPGTLWLLPIMASGAGGPAPPYQPTGALNAYDLASQKVTPVPMRGQSGDAPSVFDIWPR